MFCEKCGKNNPEHAEKCTYCGMRMPAKMGCSGFADILSFDAGSDNMFGSKNDRGNNEAQNADLQKLLRKSDYIMKQSRKNTVISMVAVLLSVLILICTVAFGLAGNEKPEEVGAVVTEAPTAKPKKELKTAPPVTEAPETVAPATKEPATEVPEIPVPPEI